MNKDTVRRVLATHYKSDSRNHGSPWLTTIEHAKDRLWCVGLFRYESILLKIHWVMIGDLKKLLTSIATDGRKIVVVCCSYRWQLKIGTRQGQATPPAINLPVKTAYE